MVNFQTYEARRAYLLELIEKKSHLSRAQLARKFNCEMHTITRMINDLRLNKNKPIKYSRSLGRYVLISPDF